MADRVSTLMSFEGPTRQMIQQQSRLLALQTQLSSGVKLQRAADDPGAAAQVLNLRQAQALNDQYTQNRQGARSTLSEAESAISGVTDLLQSIKQMLISAGNPGLQQGDRQSIAAELQANFQSLLSLANKTDSKGNYLFAGAKMGTQPFSQGATGVQYAGDQASVAAQISNSRQIAINDNGQAVFEEIQTGNGTFLTQATGTNTGSALIDGGIVANASALTGQNYRLTFTVTATPTGNVTTYDVLNTTTSATISSGNVYTSGQAITVAGMQFAVSGAPATGDQFTIVPSSNQSVFETVSNAITLLQTTLTGSGSGATLTNGLNQAMQHSDNALDHLLTIQASIGARLHEMDAWDSSAGDLKMQYSKQISDLSDLDYTQAISEMSQQQVFLEAAQKTFTQVSGLSLFNLL